jgi:outer membrane protein assembly factor BamB
VSAEVVCAIFANGDLACLDHGGKRKWAFNLGVPANHYGHSSSLLIDSGVLFVQYDHSSEALLMAFDVASGNMLWDVARDAISWGSPALVQTGDGTRHLVLVDETTVRGYDPKDGSILWQAECLGGEVAPSPAYEDGIVFVANEYAQACGVRIDAGGNSEVLWSWYDALPDVASPVATNGHVYLATSYGEVVCLNGRDGKLVWRHEFDTGFYSSPVVVEGRIHLTDLAGRTTVFSTGESFEKLGGGVLGEACFATPAFVNGRIVIRGGKHLFCIGEE